MTDPRIQLPSAAQLAVLGSPIAHSQSPAIHTAAYRTLGLAWQYGRHELQSADLASFLAERDEHWRGLSLTMPLKEEAHRLATVLDPIASESGVVNTLFRVTGAGDSAAWAGFNTDVGGLAAAIARENFDASHTLVFGAGATAVSAVLAARSLGAERVTVFARRLETAVDLAQHFDGTQQPGSEAVRVEAAELYLDDALSRAAQRETFVDASLVISTLPGGSVDWDRVATLGLADTFDVSYNPWPSELATRTEALRKRVAAGTGMLVEQALLQIRIFMNGDPALPLENETAVLAAMRDAVVA
ncbi:shikimate dehydrogenase [Leucobacter sp. UT-8R-CII-1-4]|uniref:shikimate dehydrogenase family protein n=1 Tax=Leucobacter sp. UT-8R-CII-1-4 TaxID=3040075 RepID=UPI0024A89F59|nr:shikimate dehydrogenase [Leucobacter sp. UT-8R-CII-1-4]MDI6024195.1 shikimate dehydrogenase [Leucobacter sp. UT-8R-CII-1-4]